MTRVQKRLSAVINFARIVLEIDLENVEDGNNQRRVSIVRSHSQWLAPRYV
jgi:hypothetical protein